MLNIKVILGSTRQGRFSDKPGAWVMSEIAKRPDMQADLLDLRDYPMPFFDEPVSPNYAKEPFTNAAVAAWTKKITESDGYIVVIQEYNHGIPAVLKNAFDYVAGSAWGKKPLAFVAYGSLAGARAVEQLRLVAAELQMAPLRNGVFVPEFWKRTDDAGAFKGDDLSDKAVAMIDELAWWGHALQAARNK